jgi:signal transduction histidine kinase
VSGPAVLGALAVALAEVPLTTPHPPTAADWITPTAVVAALWLAGVLARHERRRAERRRADRAARQSRATLADERLRIAREMTTSSRTTRRRWRCRRPRRAATRTP